MKKNLMLLVMAFAGGFVSLGAYKLFFDNDQAGIMLTAANAPVYNASYSGLPVDGSVDFTAAAERTVNSVVHVKTQSTMQPVFNPWSDFFGTSRNPRCNWHPDQV
jgi:serine protease Do